MHFLGPLAKHIRRPQPGKAVTPIQVPTSAEEDGEIEKSQSHFSGAKSILKVSIITVMNGGDNIGAYIPFFSPAKGAEIAVYVVTYFILLGVWYLLAFLVLKQKHIVRLAQKYADIEVPFLYVGLGVYVVVKSSCCPWSMERIDTSASNLPGRTVMALVTTFVLLICIIAMLWFKLRKREAPAQTLTNDENCESTEQNTDSSVFCFGRGIL